MIEFAFIQNLLFTIHFVFYLLRTVHVFIVFVVIQLFLYFFGI